MLVFFKQNQHKTVPPKPGSRAMHQNGYQGHGQGYQASYHNQHNQGYHHQPNQGYHHQHNQGYQNNRSNNQTNWVNRGPMRARGRQRPSGFRNNQTNQGGTNKTRNTLKFDNDYDFEQANTQFEELRSQLGKVII